MEQLSTGYTAFGPGDARTSTFYQMIHIETETHNRNRFRNQLSALAAVGANVREDSSYSCDLTAVEPFPWFFHPSLNLLPNKVEDVPDSVFETLQDGDILFIDSSHMLRPGGDIVHEFLRLLPLINNAGVYIHVHDIFTILRLTERWVKSWHFFWNE
ncbi:MAG: hypothetical protein H6821_12175 [Planctomycetaceae bacterium]|nr:hypothetical protein [Planctomycetaceae bacterium]